MSLRLSILDTKLSGIETINWSLIWSKKSYSVLSTFAYSNICWIFWIGFARYSEIVAVEPDVPPVIVSPFINFCWPLTYKNAFLESSTRIVAVAFDVPPVIISPLVNWPVVPSPVSVTILSPSSFNI